MNNSKTPKIVVGVVLVAAYATGLAVFALREKHDNVVAESAPVAPATQIAEAVPAPAVLPDSAEVLPSVADSAAMISSAAPTTSVATGSVGGSSSRIQSGSALRSKEQAIAALATTPAMGDSAAGKTNPAGEVASVGNDAVSAADEAPSSEDSTAVSEPAVESATETDEEFGN